MKRSFLLILITLSLIFSSFPTDNTVAAKDDFFSKGTQRSQAKLGPSLNSALNLSDISIKGIERVKKDTERLHVYIEFSNPSVLDALGKFGKLENLNEKFGIAEMILPAQAIKGLLNNPHITSIREVMKPVVNRGLRTSEGFKNVNGHGVESYLRTNDFAGDNIKIGVISDGVAGLSDSIASGDLPDNVVVLNNRFSGAEGTAMLEIIYDLAPHAQLYFHDYGSSSLDFIEAINSLAAQGVDIIIDDVVFLDEPFYEDSIIAKHIDQLVSSTGILYLSSAGNYAESHYQNNYRPILRNGVYEHDFSTVDSGVNRLPIVIPARTSVLIMLQWNEPFNNSIKDLELAICPDFTSTNCFVSDSWQLGAGYSPVEYVELYNSANYGQWQYVTVYSESALTNVNIEIYMFGGATVQNYGTRSDSTFGHSTAASVLSIASTSDGFTTQSNYSSQGPFTMLDGTKRNKPDFIGRDCVMVTGYGGFPTNFCGTSAAAPHIGAIAALLLSNEKTLSRSQLIDAMKLKSVDMGLPGFDPQTGNGFVHLGIFSSEITLQKGQVSEFDITLEKDGAFTTDNASVVSVSSTLKETKQVAGTMNYVYHVSVQALADGVANVRFTAKDSTEIFRRKYVVSHRLLDFSIDTQDDLYLPLNHTLPINVTLYPANANNATFTFTSSDSTVATVDDLGKITTLSAGTTRIRTTHTATGLFETRTIHTGILSTSVSVTPASATIMGIDETLQLSATLFPANATFTKIHWSSSQKVIATVDENGLVTGHDQGDVIIRATSEDGKSTIDVPIRVVKPLTAISFNSPTITVYYSGTFFTRKFGVAKTPADSIETGLIWSSSNPEIMETDDDGNITFKALGTSEISVRGPRGLYASTMMTFTPYIYNVGINVHRNGTIVDNAYKITGGYGTKMSIAELKAHYQQTIGITPGYDVNFYDRITYQDAIPQYFGLTSDFVFNSNDSLEAMEFPIEIKSLVITDVSINNSTLNVNGRFEPNRPLDIRFRYTVSDPTVLKTVSDSVSSMCTKDEVEYACTPGSFEILKAGSVTVTLESFDGTYKDTVLVTINGTENNYQINLNTVQSLRVSSHNSNTLALLWSSVAGALGYEVYRSTIFEGPYEKVADVGSSVLTYLDGGRIVNQPTYYQVCAKLKFDELIIAGPLSAVTEGRTKPDPIIQTMITPQGGTKLKLEVNVSDQPAAIQWAYARHPEGPYTILPQSAQPIQTVDNLHPGQTYYFKVRYVMDTVYGPIISEYSSLFTAKPMPLAPTVSAYFLDATTIRVDVITSEPGWIYMYHVDRYINGVQDIATQSQQSKNFQFNNMNLKEDDVVTFKAYISLLINNQSIDSPLSEFATAVKGVTLSQEVSGPGGTLKFFVNGKVMTNPIAPLGGDVVIETDLMDRYRVYRWMVNGEILNHRDPVFTLENVVVNTTISVEFVLTGDLNNDYQMSATDLVAMRRYLAGLTDITDKGKAGGDIDNNGTVSTTDLVRLRRRLAGLE